MTGRAALPMYDWPEVGPVLDRFWHGVRDRLRDLGLAAPDGLSRGSGLAEFWAEPDLILGQVCALNPVREGVGIVVPIGTLHHVPPADLPSCGPGDYYSVIVCRADDRRGRDGDLAAFGGARLVANGTDSQSGYWSLGHHLRGLVSDGPLLGPCRFTGSHRASIRAIAAGDADLGAIDVHSWALAVEHEPAARSLAVIGTTAPTPGVVCVTGASFAEHADAIAGALADASTGLAGSDAEALRLAGFRRRRPDEFEIVIERVAVAGRHPWHA